MISDVCFINDVNGCLDHSFLSYSVLENVVTRCSKKLSSKIDQSDLWHLGGLESQPTCQACPASSRQLLRPQAAQAQVRDPTGEMDSPGETGAMKFPGFQP